MNDGIETHGRDRGHVEAGHAHRRERRRFYGVRTGFSNLPWFGGILDILPEPEVLRIRSAGVVSLRRGVFHREARNLDDTAIDRIHEAEIADEPRVRAAFGVSPPVAASVAGCT